MGRGESRGGGARHAKVIEREKREEGEGGVAKKKTEKENVRKGVNKPRRELLSFEGFFFSPSPLSQNPIS